MTRKEQKEERRQAILMTALTLFVEKGYPDTKISDIAAAVPMSTGLLFHYFDSKETLLTELVKMGAEGTKMVGMTAKASSGVPADQMLSGFLGQLFAYAKDQPWVFNMFVLMGQVRRPGMPEEARKISFSVDSISSTAKLIKAGQKEGIFRKGDPKQLSLCFWSAVQGIMEEMTVNEDMKIPDPEWIVSILRP